MPKIVSFNDPRVKEIQLVMNWNFIAKENRIWKFWVKQILYTSKENHIQVEKEWSVWKSQSFNFWFLSKFQSFSKIALLGPNRYWGTQSHEFWWHLSSQMVCTVHKKWLCRCGIFLNYEIFETVL